MVMVRARNYEIRTSVFIKRQSIKNWTTLVEKVTVNALEGCDGQQNMLITRAKEMMTVVLIMMMKTIKMMM